MTDDEIMKLWIDAYSGQEHSKEARLLQFAALIREECERERREAHERIMSEQCPSDEKHCTCVPVLRDRIASLEGDVDEAEQTVVDLRAIETGLRMRLANVEKEGSSGIRGKP